ncbi:MAG TPA: hypothetical protein VFB72_13960, partial [Verrucomicrobiae bacterium]|nr:hypothetical protein [Verrucomicrobiae bacterium]
MMLSGKNRIFQSVWWWAAALIVCVFGWTDFARAQADSLYGKPVVGQNADHQLEVFKVGADGELRHRWRKPSNGDWSAWSSLGSGFLPGMALLTNVDGQLAVFAVNRTNHALMSIRQKAPNGHEWLEWTNLGGEIQPPLVAARNADGRLEVFAVSLNGGNVLHLWQT